jgi:hypothetical protein
MSGVAQPKRTDPKPRPVEGPASEFALVGEDPNRHYTGVSLLTSRFGQTYYEAIGYEVEIARKDGPKFRFGRVKDGEPMVFQDIVLMSCTKERKAEIDLHGPFGGSGQEEVDRIHNLMVNRRAGRSVLGNLRKALGPSGEPLFDVQNETETPRGVMTL